MAYTTPSAVREVSNISSDRLDNTELQSLCDRASKRVNRRLSIDQSERVMRISTWRRNKINGTNKTFFTKEYPLGDKSGDFSIGTADVKVYSIGTTTGTRTLYTVSNINGETGKVVLSTAPPSYHSVYMEYQSVPLQITHDLVQEATTYLTAGLAMLRLHGRSIKEYTLGSMKIKKENVGGEFFQEYEKIMNDIRSERGGTRGKASSWFGGAPLDVS